MYIEKRKDGKQYLVHAYRDSNNKVKKLRKYLGRNPSKEIINNSKIIIKELIKKINTELFNFSLTPRQINSLNKSQISIHHLKKEEWEIFTEDFVYNTNAIEGSTVLRDEVHDILHNKPTNSEEIETIGVANALNYIRKTNEEFSIELIKKLHELCFKDSKSFAGKIRNVEVVIKNSKGDILHRGTRVKELNTDLSNLIKWYKNHKSEFKPLVLSAIIHNQFEEIHPFQDGNGRVGRLLLNYILLKSNYPPINILLQDRQEYYKTLQSYSKNGDIKPTLKFLIKQYKKTLNRVTTKKN